MAKELQNSTAAVLSGTGQEVIGHLLRSREQRTVAVTFPDNEQGAAAERVIRQVMEFLPQLIRERQQETLRKLIDAFLAGVTPRRPTLNRPVGGSRPIRRR